MTSNLDIFTQSEEFIMGWAGEKPEPVRYGGEQVLLPAHNDVAEPGAGSPFRCPSAKDRDGRPIPGTVSIKDIVEYNPSRAENVKVFDASSWCKGVVNIKHALVERGLFVVRKPEDVPAAKAAARRRFEAKQDMWAEQTIRDEVAWKARYEEKHGQAAPDSSNLAKVQEAMAWLAARPARRAASFSKGDLLAAIGQGDKSPAPLANASAPVIPAELQPDPEPEPSGEMDPRLIGSAMADRAEELGLYLKRDVLMGLLKGETSALAQAEQMILEAETKKQKPEPVAATA